MSFIKKHERQTFFIIFLNLNFTFGQTPSDKIYETIERFDDNPNSNRIKFLYQAEEDFNLSKNKKEDYKALLSLYSNIGYYEFEYNNLLKATEYYEKAWILYQNKPFLNGYNISEHVLKSFLVHDNFKKLTKISS